MPRLTKPSFLVALFLAFLAVHPSPSSAGVLKNLYNAVSKTVEDYNNDMWLAEDSVGGSVVNGIKGKKGFNQIFTDSVGAMQRAQDNAASNVKGIFKAIKDIVLWLPRKIQAAFNKLMGKVNDFRDKLNSMNQGATVKERWKNLTGMGGAAQSFSGSSSVEESLDAGDFDAFLEDSDAARGSLSPDQVQDILAENEAKGSSDPTQSQAPYGKLMRLSRTIEADSKRSEAGKRIRKGFLVDLDQALTRKDPRPAAELLKSSLPLFAGNPEGMQKALEAVSRRHGKRGASVRRFASRLAKISQQRASQTAP